MIGSFSYPRSWGNVRKVGEQDANGDPVPVYPSYSQFGIDISNPDSYPGTGTQVYSLDENGNVLQTGTMGGGANYELEGGIDTIYFDGTGDYISFPSFDFTGQVSFSYWIKLETKANIHTLLATAGANDETDGFKVCVNNWNTDDGRIMMEIGNGSIGGKVLSSNADVVPRDGTTWVMCTYAFSFEDNVRRFWVNGVEQGTYESQNPASDPKVNGTFYVGAMIGGSYGMKGHLAEMKFWGGLLVNDEVQTLWNDTKVKYGY